MDTQEKLMLTSDVLCVNVFHISDTVNVEEKMGRLRLNQHVWCNF